MKIQNFLTSLLPSFKKDRVIEDCRLTKTEIKEYTQPAYDAAIHLLKDWKFQSPEMVSMVASFDRLVKGAGRDNIIVTIQKSFHPILVNLDHVHDMVEKTYNEEVAGGGFTYLKANLLQFVECVSFVSKFSRKFLQYCYICETAQFDENNTKLADCLAKAEIEWLETNFVSFCTALNIASGNPGNVQTALTDVPDIVITSENADTLSSTMGETKLDPFQMKLIPIFLNPIYHVRMMVAEWQVARYKAAHEESKLLQLRKLNLEKLADGKPDAAIQKQIDYMENRIAGLNYKLAQMETTHGH